VKRLDIYIINQFIKNIGIIMAALIAIYFLIDFVEKYDNFAEKGKPMGMVLKFFLLNIPFILDQMGPVCILLAGVITLGILNHSNELIALKACGIPLRRIITPIILAGAVSSMLLLSMSQFILPKSMAITNRIWIEEVKGKVPLGIFRNGRYYYRSKEGFFSFLRPDPKQDIFLSFSFSSWDDDYQLSKLVAAEQAVWHDNSWQLSMGQLQTNVASEDFKTEIFKVRRFDFSEQPSDFFVPEHRSKELSLTGLFMDTKHQQTEADLNKAWTEFFGRISYTLLGLPLLLVGLPLLLIVYRKWGRDLSLAIPVSCGLAFVCWGLWGTQQALAKAGYLSPFLAASSVHLVIGSIGIFLLLREDI
jgi:lipopolysaccharide export system permease protein